MSVKILLDSGSQKTYISERVVQTLNLKAISSQKMKIKTFGNKSEKAVSLKEYSLCIKSFTGVNLYLKAFAVPLICTPLSGQNIDAARENYPFLKELDLADKGAGECKIDVLIGSDYYWEIIDGETKRGNKGGPVAISSKLGWILSGPIENKHYTDCAVNLTHVMKISMPNTEGELLHEVVEKFWNLDSVGIKENEKSVYEKFQDT